MALDEFDIKEFERNRMEKIKDGIVVDSNVIFSALNSVNKTDRNYGTLHLRTVKLGRKLSHD